MTSVERRVGTAGWTLPRDLRAYFGEDGTQLERYARQFSCVEINSTFYRPHRVSTYERWARSVPDDFRFALKVPKDITHVRRLTDIDADAARFLESSAALGAKRDVLLVQLPPSFAFDKDVIAAAFACLRARYAGRMACEPRHASWFTGAADALLATFGVARVAADPPAGGAPFAPGGAADFHYWRLHGSPRAYYSAYEDAGLDEIAAALNAAGAAAWCIFDNTALGAATANALALKRRLGIAIRKPA
jgi:uncharacterized protein YecE (DUF72 family)